MSSFTKIDENEELIVQNEKEKNDINPAILIDQKYIKDEVSSAAIVTLTNDFITVIIIRTVYAKIQLRIQYTDNYPNSPPIVELSSATLPIPLLKSKEKECIEKAKEHVGEPQVSYIYDTINDFIQTNLFVPCWKEMKQVMNLCEGKGLMGANEKEGILTIKLMNGQYTQCIKLIISQEYPIDGVKIEFTTGTYPSDIMFMFKSQAEEVVRRCLQGQNLEQVFQAYNPIKLEPLEKIKGKITQQITSDSIVNIKHDLNILKQISDLRVAATNDGRKNQYYKKSNQEKKEARRILSKLATSESLADKEQEAILREQEQNELNELLNIKICDVSQPSLFAVCKFLIEEYSERLPVELCQKCNKTVLPTDCNSEAIKNSRSENKPIRVFCGHWLHYSCLKEWLETPPFIRRCPVCIDRRIWHPDWPEDYKLLEKAYMKAEERKREEDDIASMMGF